MKKALTCGSSTQHHFDQEQESEVAADPAHGVRARVSGRRAQRNGGRPAPARSNSVGLR